MSSNAVYALGTLIQRENTPGGGVFTTIAEVRSIDGPEIDRDEIEVTHQQSPAKHREVIAGLRDSGSISFGMNFQPGNATHDAVTGLMADQVTGTIKNFKIVFPSSPPVAYLCPAFVKKVAITAPVDGVLGADVEIRVASAPTLTGVTP